MTPRRATRLVAAGLATAWALLAGTAHRAHAQPAPGATTAAVTARVVGHRAGRLVLDRGRAAGVREGDLAARLAPPETRAGIVVDERADASGASSAASPPARGRVVGTVVWLDPERAEVLATPDERVAVGTELVLDRRADVSAEGPLFAYDQHGEATVFAAAGETLEAGTCQLAGAHASGDTVLSITGPTGTMVARDDDTCGLASYVRYTVPPGGDGAYTVVGSCYGSARCSGRVVVRRRGAGPVSESHEPFVVTPRRDGVAPDTSLRVALEPSQELFATTCAAPRRGATQLALVGAGHVESNNAVLATGAPACAGGQQLRYFDPWRSGEYWLRAGCDAPGAACSGTVTYRARRTTRALVPRWRAAVHARGLVNLGGSGGGVADAELALRDESGFALRVEGLPLAVAGGPQGGLYALGGRALLGAHGGWWELGAGAGAISLNRRLANARDAVAPEVSVYARIGFEPWLSLEVLAGATWVRDRVFGATARARVRLRLSPKVELEARGGYSVAGLVYGEGALVYWARGDGLASGSLGVSGSVGAAEVFFQPACALGPCADNVAYGGATLGAGLVWHP